MPTYTCTTRPGLLDGAQREAIAGAICAAHSAATGAPAFFAQVVFEERAHRFIGGAAASSQVMVRGDIRAGRTRDQRTALAEAIVDLVVRIAGVAAGDIWVYLNELSPSDMIEFGRVLPEPGAEAAWIEALPETLRKALMALEDRAKP